MADIRLVDAFKAFQELPHQLAAAQWLDDHLTAEQRQGFQELFRADPAPKAEASPSPGIDWLSACLPLVKQFEGCVLTAYPDPGTGGAPWTIGWGHTGPEVSRGTVWSQQQADAALLLDLKEANAGMLRTLPMAAGYSAARQAALTSWVFNVGAAAAAESTLAKRLKAGDDPQVVVRQELPRWNKGGNGVLPGLTRRRAAEVELFCGGPAGQATAVPPVTDAPIWPADLVGPKMRPTLKPGDHHLIANDQNQTLTAYAHDGQRIWSIPCLCRGQGGEAEWNTTGTDTPPGLYRVGKVYRDYEDDPSPQNHTADRQAYGWFSFDLIGLEGQEGPGSANHRDGIMIHGGGTACGWPGAWAPLQPLHPTMGCIRCHNLDLKERILPLVTLGTIWVSVLQEAA